MERNGDREELVRRALEMVRAAYAPYSRFQVGAAVRGASGRVYAGANVENAAFGAGVCAERNALFQAVAAGERRILAVAVCGGPEGRVADFCPPCGICRQALREFCDPAACEVVLATSETNLRALTLERLLPESFGPAALAPHVAVFGVDGLRTL